ncbi:antitoxin Xre/MbcA/ParS toxin-binding domain-containing protein [Beijerinckia sp. L45]|uniref:antitoxin Xre/MbcA/ParS toxin-binding domain-containing protein n=1 Tax=Beijerinckia sp. L45 TaxID=1641855 RepID=UPI00131B78CE|nr:antitoxin Xre/MbcA/ParS toxin-binding domain-containing protein [Beijerinckia sp. L45]
MSQLPSSVFGQIDVLVDTQSRSNPEFALPASVIPHFERAGMEADEVYRIIGPKNEVAHLVAENADLSVDQTDRASRVAHIVSLAERVFGKREKAFLWLRLPNQLLGDKRPIDCLARESTARLVQETLLQIEYGIFA